MVKQGLKVYPSSAKLHMMHAQLLQGQKPPNISAAREALAVGLRKCPTATPLWIMASRLEEQAGLRIKARALLEKGRTLNPKSEELWLESVQVEQRDGSGAHKAMLARGMPLSPSLASRTGDLGNSSPRHPHQPSKLCRHPVSCTRTRFGSSRDQPARLARSMRSRRRTTRRPSSSRSRGSSGQNARSRRRAIGSAEQSPQIPTMATRGRGGGSLRSSMVQRWACPIVSQVPVLRRLNSAFSSRRSTELPSRINASQQTLDTVRYGPLSSRIQRTWARTCQPCWISPPKLSRMHRDGIKTFFRLRS